jgi:hypothetical protein
MSIEGEKCQTGCGYVCVEIAGLQWYNIQNIRERR